MKWFYFSILPLLSTFKVTMQGYFSKGKVKSVADSIKFNGFMFLFAALSLIVFTVRALPSIETLLFSLCVGLLTLGFQCFYVFSLRTGAVSLSATIVNFSSFIP